MRVPPQQVLLREGRFKKHSFPTFASVATPTELHLQHAEELLQGGVSVLMEKPIMPMSITDFDVRTIDLHAFSRLQDLATRKSLSFTVQLQMAASVRFVVKPMITVCQRDEGQVGHALLWLLSSQEQPPRFGWYHRAYTTKQTWIGAKLAENVLPHPLSCLVEVIRHSLRECQPTDVHCVVQLFGPGTIGSVKMFHITEQGFEVDFEWRMKEGRVLANFVYELEIGARNQSHLNMGLMGGLDTNMTVVRRHRRVAPSTGQKEELWQ